MSLVFGSLLDDDSEAQQVKMRVGKLLGPATNARSFNSDEKPSLESFSYNSKLTKTARRPNLQAKNQSHVGAVAASTSCSEGKVLGSAREHDGKRKAGSGSEQDSRGDTKNGFEKKSRRRIYVVQSSDEEDEEFNDISAINGRENKSDSISVHNEVSKPEAEERKVVSISESEESEDMDADVNNPVVEVLRKCEKISKGMAHKLQPLQGSEMDETVTSLVTQVKKEPATSLWFCADSLIVLL